MGRGEWGMKISRLARVWSVWRTPDRRRNFAFHDGVRWEGRRVKQGLNASATGKVTEVTRLILVVRGVALAVCLAVAASPVVAQVPGADEPAGAPVPARGEELTVYLMTMGPGAAFWERFGHNAIRVRDDARGTDIAYNYGMFSFEQENFFLRFIRGQMDYWMAPEDAQWLMAAYPSVDRSVWLQELNLTPAQRADLRDFLERNALPENRFYRYDYYRDNCSTRVRDAIDLVIGGQLRLQTEGISSGTTYREHTRALTSADPALYSGLMLGLGQPVDREITAWEEMFLPMELRERIRDMTIDNGAGERVPLVLSEEVVYERSAPLSDGDTSTRWPIYTLIGVVLGLAIVFTGRRRALGQAGGGVFPWLAGVWSALAGTLGVVLVGLWAFTDHATSYWNENILQFSPLLLVLAVLIPGAVRGRETLRLAAWLAGLIAAISLAGFMAQVFPALSQSNGEIIGLALPVNLAIAYALARLRDANGPGGGKQAVRAAARNRTAAAA